MTNLLTAARTCLQIARDAYFEASADLAAARLRREWFVTGFETRLGRALDNLWEAQQRFEQVQAMTNPEL
jgi:hypothetical protein